MGLRDGDVGVCGPSRMLAAYTRRGRWYLGDVDIATGRMGDRSTDRSSRMTGWLPMRHARAARPSVADAAPERVVDVDLASGRIEVDPVRVLVATRSAATSRSPEPIEFPTDGGQTAHAFYYAPRNRDVSGAGRRTRRR